jgi:hypothetical protein
VSLARGAARVGESPTMTLSGPPPSAPDPIGPGGSGGRRSGCLVALYVVFGLGALLLVGAGVAAWLFLRSETGQHVLDAAKEGASWAEEASHAPGTDALREAGCENAMVSSFGQILGLASHFLPPEKASDLQQNPLAQETVVVCQIGLFSKAEPDCAAMASVYGSAVSDPPERFVVMVQRQGLGRRACQGFYAPDGSFLGPIEAK